MTETDPDWRELVALLEPIHRDALAFARGIARSNADGDDLYQEAVVRAAHKLSGLRERERFAGWFYRIVTSVHRSRARRSFWRRLVSSDEPAVAAVVDQRAGEDGQAWVDARASAERAAQALATLPAAQREALVLFELHGLSVEEIARIQGGSPGSVKTRLSRGRERLRRFYAELGHPAARAARPPPVIEESCRG